MATKGTKSNPAHDCGHKGAQLVHDPYAEDIEGRVVWIKVCTGCLRDLEGDL